MTSPTGPYRRPAPRPPPPKTRVGDQAAGRRGARALLPFQLGVVVAFFLPSYEACHVEGTPATPESLADFALGNLSLFTFALLAPLCLILADMIATVRAWATRRPVRRHGARFIALLPAAFLVYVCCAGAFDGGVVPGALSIATSLVVLPYLLLRTHTTAGHLSHFFGALAVLATQVPLAFLYIGAWIRHGDDFSGAMLHVASIAAATMVGLLTFAARPSPIGIPEAIARARARHGARRSERRSSPLATPAPSPIAPRPDVADTAAQDDRIATATGAEGEALSEEEAAAWTTRTETSAERRG